MSPHNLLPLVAFVLNVSLAALSLLRNPGSRLNRVFAYFASSMALWNFGVFLLRASPDEWTAYLTEILIHVGVIALPAFYYHFILIFLDSTTRHRPSLVLAYTGAFVYELINLSGSSMFMTGVKSTYWGWAPATGPLYLPYFLFFNGFMIYGLVQMIRANRGLDSSFRRNRGTLILLGTLVSLTGGMVDFARFILARFIPAADLVYPVGIPANMVFALMLGTSIVRYRLFAVAVAVKKTAVYALVGTVITILLGVAVSLTEEYFDLKEASALWVIVPVGAIITLLLSPLGQGLDDRVQRMMFSKRQGCYETLLHLSKRMSSILNFNELVDSLVHGLVGGIPATHATLMIHDPVDRPSSQNYREETTLEESAGPDSIRVRQPDRAVAEQHRGPAGQGRGQAQPAHRQVLRDGRGRARSDQGRPDRAAQGREQAERHPAARREALGRDLRRPGARRAPAAGHPGGHLAGERPPVRGPGHLQRPAHGGQPPQVPVPGQHVARAAHAAELDHRLLQGAAEPSGRRPHRAAGGLRALGAQLQPPPARADHRHPRLLPHRVGQVRDAPGEGGPARRRRGVHRVVAAAGARQAREAREGRAPRPSAPSRATARASSR